MATQDRLSPQIRDEMLMEVAIKRLRAARDLLKKIGAKRATEKVRRAITSAEGARRHLLNRSSRERRNDNQ